MLRKTFKSFEKQIFRNLNAVLEPAIRAGVGAPWLTPIGAVVLETTGRKSGRSYRTPLLASESANLLVVSTVRPGSHWLKNLAVRPQTQVWLRGEAQPVTAYLVGPELAKAPARPIGSPLVEFVLDRLRPLSAATGVSFAVLEKVVEPQAVAGRALVQL